MNSINNSQAIYTLIKARGFSNLVAEFMTCQGAHETSGYTSALFVSNNNAFGMKYAGQSSALGEKNGYAYYSGVEKSVEDLIKWWNYVRSNIFQGPILVTSIDAYVQVLKDHNYFEDSYDNYLKGCKYWQKILFGEE